MSRILVVGSANVDYLVSVDRHPAAGHTVVGYAVTVACGGKGANQAVAAARLGAEVSLVAAVGADDAGARLRAGLRESTVDDRLVRAVDAPTGMAAIAVTPDGDNSILVIPGANGLLGADHVAAAGRLGDVGTVVVQLEVPDGALNAAAELAADRSARLVVNLAPARPVPARLLEDADPLVLNEHEAAELTGRPGASDRELAVAAAALARSVVVTAGSRGAVCVAGGTAVSVPAPRVAAVDTTGAGDAFVGALVVALDRGHDLPSATELAVRVSAHSVTRPGAQPSYPTADQVAVPLGR